MFKFKPSLHCSDLISKLHTWMGEVAMALILSISIMELGRTKVESGSSCYCIGAYPFSHVCSWLLIDFETGRVITIFWNIESTKHKEIVYLHLHCIPCSCCRRWECVLVWMSLHCSRNNRNWFALYWLSYRTARARLLPCVSSSRSTINLEVPLAIWADRQG